MNCAGDPAATSYASEGDRIRVRLPPQVHGGYRRDRAPQRAPRAGRRRQHLAEGVMQHLSAVHL